MTRAPEEGESDGSDTAGRRRRPIVPSVDIAPALTKVAFSAEVVAQTLEGIFVYLEDGAAHLLHPIHAPTLRLGWRADLQPAEVILEGARRYGLDPMLVHSTSWRFEQARVVLTYVVAVQPPQHDSLDPHLSDELVARSELARGDAMGPPPEIGIAQVVEHAFRHLSWLVKDDVAVREALPAWVEFLSGYVPEPFRAFGAPPG